MARIVLSEFISIGMDDEDVVTKYQFATDEGFNNIVTDKTVDRFLTEIVDPIIMPDGRPYDGFSDIYARVKYIVRGVDNGWHELNMCNITEAKNY